MKKKAFKAQQKRIIALNEKWAEVIGLGGWDVSFIFYRKYIPKYREATATALPNWKYMWCTFRFDCKRAAKCSDQELEYTFLHEACHAVVCEMRESKDGDGHEERVCTLLGHIIQKAREAGVV